MVGGLWTLIFASLSIPPSYLLGPDLLAYLTHPNRCHVVVYLHLTLVCTTKGTAGPPKYFAWSEMIAKSFDSLNIYEHLTPTKILISVQVEGFSRASATAGADSR